MCAVCGEGPSEDNIVKECDYCLRNYHKECAGDSALWCDSTSDRNFFPCPACTQHGRPQPMPQSTNPSDVYLAGQGALGLGLIRDVYKLQDKDGSILHDESGREDVRIEVQVYLKPKDLKAHLKSGIGVPQELKTVGEGLGDLDVARRVFLTDSLSCCGVHDVHGAALVLPHVAFQNSEGEDVFLCDHFFCSTTQSLQSIQAYEDSQVSHLLRCECQWCMCACVCD